MTRGYGYTSQLRQPGEGKGYQNLPLAVAEVRIEDSSRLLLLLLPLSLLLLFLTISLHLVIVSLFIPNYAAIQMVGPGQLMYELQGLLRACTSRFSRRLAELLLP